MTSKHYKKYRNKREKLINKIGNGNIIDEFIVDRNHKDGLEIHSITDTGIIIIRNYQTEKLITKLVARPKQIERYYKNLGRHPPEWLIEISFWHTSLLYNRI